MEVEVKMGYFPPPAAGSAASGLDPSRERQGRALLRRRVGFLGSGMAAGEGEELQLLSSAEAAPAAEKSWRLNFDGLLPPEAHQERRARRLHHHCLGVLGTWDSWSSSCLGVCSLHLLKQQDRFRHGIREPKEQQMNGLT